MAIFDISGSDVGFSTSTISSSVDWFSLDSFSAVQYAYLSGDGNLVVLDGAGFTYGGSNNPTGGAVTSGYIDIDDDDALNPEIVFSGFSGSLLTMTNGGSTANTSGFYNELLGGADAITGSAFNDTLKGLGGADTIDGGAGSDTLGGDGGDDVIFGGAGFDFISCDDGNDVVRAGSVADTVAGENGDDNLAGQGGNDLLIGGDGNDTIRGNTGLDDIFGDDGDDALAGRAGADTLRGDAGDDILTGKGGADLYVFDNLGAQTDTIRTFAAGVGFVDEISLNGFGTDFDTFLEVMAAATQVGADTHFDFGGGNILIVKGVLVGAFAADDFNI